MTVLTEGIHPVEFIMSEATWHRSRDAVKIAAEQTVEPGNLLGGKAVAADVTTAQSRTGTGNGVLTFASPAVSSKVKTGRYTITMTGSGATAAFQVEGPDGNVIGVGAVGTAFDKEVKFTVADGAADFAAGDQIFLDIGVEPTDFEHVPWDPAGTDGSEKIRGIACYGAVTGVGETKKITALRRDAEVNGHMLNLPNGVTAAQTAKAYADLAALGIIVRN
ncbi:head decoration protein [Bosea sp. (in: a-proteobacteria)]|uniref:head decoration protein n=1 Tax=Bosea sp. (in: a-proteobacteria) TaxID=1871050 RepID=UPI001ACAD08C|nr:head decoration protein [Bosea sp. (in: a-proteobacteria)]MBN9444375.1 head decoration protein [Bosea sp. (in: a-proteobacteria)]